MDLAITLYNVDSHTFSFKVFIYNTTSSSYDLQYEQHNSTQNPFIADLGESRGLNILLYKLNKRIYLTYNNNTNGFIENDFINVIPDNLNLCDASAKYAAFPFDSPNANGYVDVDGDCLNDLVITSYDPVTGVRYLEIWKSIIEEGNIKYCLTNNNVYTLPNEVGLPSIVDVDRRAMPDLVFPIMNSYPPKIVIAYNKINLQYDWTDNYCDTHKPISIKKGSVNAHIPTFYEQIKIDINNNFISTITIHKNTDLTFYIGNDSNDNYYYPHYLRFVDINKDSYPDFITVLYNKSSQSKTPYVFLNQKLLYNKSFNGYERRTFSQEAMYSFLTISNAVVATFFDFGDKGHIDIIIIDSNHNNIGLYNHNVYDAYTIKSLLLFKNNCFYCNEFGSTQRFITTNIDGSRRMDFSIQAAQSCVAGGLMLPYAYIGIGRSNNYLENFHIISGCFNERKNNDKVYTPVIPNSQLVIYHENVNGKATSWKVDLIVKPTKNLKKLIIVIVLMIVVMTALTFHLQMKEREEDFKENKETFAPWFG